MSGHSSRLVLPLREPERSAAAAVVVAIAYLAIQVRQAERNPRALMQQARTERGMVLAASMEAPHTALNLGEGDRRQP